jgi:hypothetical protein
MVADRLIFGLRGIQTVLAEELCSNGSEIFVLFQCRSLVFGPAVVRLLLEDEDYGERYHLAVDDPVSSLYDEFLGDAYQV